MKRTLNLAVYIATLLVTAVLPLSTSMAATSDPQLLLAATNGKTQQIGETVSIGLNIENSATAAVKAQLQYNGDMLRYQGISQADSSFSAITVDATNGGTLSIEATEGTGDAATLRRVVTIIFAVERAGSTEVAFNGVNQIQVQNCLLFICNKVYKNVTTGSAVVLTLQAATKPVSLEKDNDTKNSTITPETPKKQSSILPKSPSESDKSDDKKVSEKTALAVTGLSVLQITSSTATVVIETSVPSSGVLVYQTRDGNADTRKIKLENTATVHRVALEHLAASTEFTIDVDMKDERGVLIHSDVIFQTLDVATSSDSTTLPAKIDHASSSMSFMNIVGVSLGAVGSLVLIGWVSAYLVGITHKARLTGAGILASRRYTLRRFTRLR